MIASRYTTFTNDNKTEGYRLDVEQTETGVRVMINGNTMFIGSEQELTLLKMFNGLDKLFVVITEMHNINTQLMFTPKKT